MVIKRTPTMITPKRDSWSAQIGEILPAENEELEELMRKEQEQDDAAAAAAEDHATGSEEVPQKSNVEKMIDRLLALKDKPAGTNSDLTEPEIISVCIQTRQIFLAQPMFLGLGVPLRICGDIHGQFTDLLKVLDKAGYPGQNNYLFLGDYVDRGRNSIEAMMLLLCYKIVYPEGLFLLRGNHESAIVNMVYGFYDECKRRYSTKVYRAFCDVFNTFPVAALVADSILCMHGGISPSLNDLDDIENIVRPCEVPNAGLLADLLWADPDPEITGWRESERGISYCFGKDALEEFMEKHDLDLIVRAHQVVEDGYEFFGNRKLVTIFTAPNYCGEFDNAGAMVVCDEDLKLSFEVFPASDM